MRFFAKTLQRKLLLTLLLVGLVPAIAGVLYAYWGSSLAIDNGVGTFLEERAQAIVSTLDYGLAREFSAALALRDALTSQPRDENYILNVAASFEEYYIIDALGKIRQSGVGAHRHTSFSLPRGLQRAQNMKTVFLDELPAPDNTSELLFIVQLNSDPREYLVCSVNSAQLLAFIPPERAGGGAIVKVFSNRGVILGDPQQDERFAEFVRSEYQHVRDKVSDWARVSPPSGRDFLVGYATSRLLRVKQREGLTSVDWTSMAEMDLQDMQQLVSYFLWRNFWFGIALTLALVLISFWLSQKFIRPIRQLHAQADRLASGDLSAHVELHTNDEIEDLSRAFNKMAVRLDRSRKSLEENMATIEHTARRLSIINHLGRSIVAAFDLPKLFQTADAQLRQLLSYDAMAVVIFNAESGASIHDIGGNLLQAAAKGQPRAIRLFCEELHLQREHGPDSLPFEGDFQGEATLNPEYQRFCVAPLRVERGLMGALLLGRLRKEEFTETERSALAQIVQFLALAIEHIELYEVTRRFADELENKVRQRTLELERTHERLLHSERFAATGRLAANIAHEINNPLGIVKNYLRIIRNQRETEKAGESEEALRIIEEELDRIARIIRSLLNFYRPTSDRLHRLSLNREVESILPLIEPALARKRIRLELDLAPDLPRVTVSPDHVRQIVLNLLKNSEDAISNSGVIKVSTSEVNGPGEHAIMLEVEDNGCGIRPEDRSRIFEPFFTTKREQGTGLGLSVTYALVENMNGSLEIDSAPGKGTRVTIRIPVVQAQRQSVMADDGD